MYHLENPGEKQHLVQIDIDCRSVEMNIRHVGSENDQQMHFIIQHM